MRATPQKNPRAEDGDTPARGRRRGDRRAQVLSIAPQLFAKRGYAGVSMQDIGQSAGVSPAALYRHFTSKGQLLETLLVQASQDVLTATSLATPPETWTGTRPLRGVLSNAVQLVVDRPGELLTYLRERERVDRSALTELATTEAHIAERWKRAIRAAEPGLDDAAIEVRQAAIYGALGSLATKPGSLASARSRTLVIDGLVCAATTMDEATVAEPDVRRAWTPPVTRRQQILTQAMSVFRREGFSGAGLSEVGEALGVSGPSIYEHFGTKSEILLDAYEQAGALVMAGALAALDRASSPEEAMQLLAASFVEVCYSNVDLIAVTSFEGAWIPEEERPRLIRRRRDLHEMWGAVLKEARPQLRPTEVRVLVRAAFRLAQAVAEISAPARTTTATATRLVCAFLHPDRAVQQRTT